MLILPAIDLLDGQVVRLKQGDYNRKTVYSHDPVSVAEKFAMQGAKCLHIVDLDGARSGVMKNLSHILEIRKRVCARMQVGGGVRSEEMIERLLAAGIDRVVLGTRAFEDSSFLPEAMKEFGSEKIVVSLDVKNGVPRVRGWTRSLSLREGRLRRPTKQSRIKQKKDCFATLAMTLFQNVGISYLIYTDITRDGMRLSPNWEGVKEVQKYGFTVIASGGVSTVEDVRRLKEMGVHGCIAGRVVYEDTGFLLEANKNVGLIM